MATIYDWTKEGMIPRRVDGRGAVNILLDSSPERRACLEIVRRTKAGHLKKTLVLLNTDEVQFLRKGLRFAVLPPGPPTEWVVREGDTHKKGRYLTRPESPRMLAMEQSAARRFTVRTQAEDWIRRLGPEHSARVVKLTPRQTYLGEGVCVQCIQRHAIRKGIREAMDRFTADSPFREQLREGLAEIDKIFAGHVCVAAVPVTESARAAETTSLVEPAASVDNAYAFSPLDPETHDEWILNSVTRRETEGHPAVERRSIRVNVNDTVTVRLTPAGVDLLNADRAGRFATSIRHRAAPPGPYTMTLWEFCVVFGSQLTMGGCGMIEKNALVLSTQRLPCKSKS